ASARLPHHSPLADPPPCLLELLSRHAAFATQRIQQSHVMARKADWNHRVDRELTVQRRTVEEYDGKSSGLDKRSQRLQVELTGFGVEAKRPGEVRQLVRIDPTFLQRHGCPKPGFADS